MVIEIMIFVAIPAISQSPPHFIRLFDPSCQFCMNMCEYYHRFCHTLTIFLFHQIDNIQNKCYSSDLYLLERVQKTAISSKRRIVDRACISSIVARLGYRLFGSDSGTSHVLRGHTLKIRGLKYLTTR